MIRIHQFLALLTISLIVACAPSSVPITVNLGKCATLTLQRPDAFGTMFAVPIKIDGNVVGKLSYNQEMVLQLQPGSYQLSSGRIPTNSVFQASARVTLAPGDKKTFQLTHQRGRVDGSVGLTLPGGGYMLTPTSLADVIGSSWVEAR